MQLNSTFGTTVNELRFTYQRIRGPRGAQPFEDRPFPFVAGQPQFRHGPCGPRELLDGQRARSGRLRAHRRLHLAEGQAHAHARHAQRVLQVPEPVHPRLLRQLPVRQPRPVRAGAGAVVRLQLLADRRSAAGGAVPRAPVRVLRRRSVACRPSNLTLTYGCSRGHPDVPGQADGNPLAVTQRSVCAPTKCRPACCGRRASASTTRCPTDTPGADARRLRAVRRPHAVRVALEPVRQHRHRVPASEPPASTRPTAFPFVPDANAQPTTIGSVATNEIDLIDPDYKYPSLMRGNLAYDRELRFLRPGRHGGVPLLAERQRHQVPEPEPGSGRHAQPDGRPVYHAQPRAGDQRPDPPDQHRSRAMPGASRSRWSGRSATGSSRTRRTSTASRDRFSTARRRRRRRTGATSTSPATRTIRR